MCLNSNIHNFIEGLYLSALILYLYQNTDRTQASLVKRALTPLHSLPFISVFFDKSQRIYMVESKYSRSQELEIIPSVTFKKKFFKNFVKYLGHHYQLTIFVEAHLGVPVSQYPSAILRYLKSYTPNAHVIPFTHIKECASHVNDWYHIHHQPSTNSPNLTIQKGNLLTCLYEVIRFINPDEPYTSELEDPSSEYSYASTDLLRSTSDISSSDSSNSCKAIELAPNSTTLCDKEEIRDVSSNTSSSSSSEASHQYHCCLFFKRASPITDEYHHDVSSYKPAGEIEQRI